ncbi:MULTISPECIES: ABC transporter family substrate-binding protein [Streptomyces]|uniref:ABC transporter family substrate-binding protein n=1 Tax=Streptomyces TaxID=1883 RepID=UPI00163C276E|nr:MULTISPECIES: ABC transporter family substrate-binding protein [Streptomyces]MBC2875182.1 ABC transporter family substrate-binding protein [Streptomyces sp. TYQ1024]UBI37013.1 ABC transporter family substrate-binding protein [Streptomyces mobaraensis]UKW29606.1 ABC transporter family substrate-binding protein [Streptomyces sp. TYQ1024]
MFPLSTSERPRVRRLRRTRRSAALLAAGALLPLPALAGCGGSGESAEPPAGIQDVAAAPRAKIADKGTLTWAVDALPATYNAFQSDADAATRQVAGAVLPALFTLDGRGRPQRNPDYLLSAEVVAREPRQVVVYRLNPGAVWSDGTPITAADFEAQWKALRGKDSAFWSTGNAGYDRIDKVERGADAREVKITFAKPYVDWASLFTPLYPRAAMASGNAFNDSMRKELKFAAGPFQVGERNDGQGTLTLVRNPRWWGDRAKLDRLVLRAVPRGERADALANGGVDLADITPAAAERIDRANAPAKKADDANKPEAAAGLHDLVVHRALEPVWTQLALNGTSGALADERVRRAVVRAVDRKELARYVLGTLGLPADPLGSHVLVAGQPGYEDNSDAVGPADPGAARDLLADAGWKEGRSEPAGRGRAQADGAGARHGRDDKAEPHGAPDLESPGIPASPAPGSAPEPAAGVPAEKPENLPEPADAGEEGGDGSGSGAGAGGDDKSARDAGGGKGSAAKTVPVRFKDGKRLALRFVLPKGTGAEPLRQVGERIARQLDAVGIHTDLVTVDDAGFFRDHIASGDFDLALYSWPASAFPATDARPIFAKPRPAADGSLQVEQNYTRVGTDQIDRLFEQASTELDAEASRDLVVRADARIWAAAGSVPLYQRPELVASRRALANVGAFGLASPRYQDMGFLR